MVKEHTVHKYIDCNHPQQTLFQSRVLLALVLPFPELSQAQLMTVLSFCEEEDAPATNSVLLAFLGFIISHESQGEV